MTERLLLLDTASLYYRAFYGMPDTMRAPDGTPVNAVRGMLDFVARLVQDHEPTRLVACMDADWRPSWRVELIPSYKAHRVLQGGEEGGEEDSSEQESGGVDAVAEMPDELSIQIPLIVEAFEHIGLATLGVADYEADDVIGTLAHRAECAVGIVTGDRDLFQLVDNRLDRRVFYTAARGVSRVEVVNEEWVSAKYSIPGRSYFDFATLRGDASDGLPGVRGIGDKTAAALVTQFGDLDTIIAAAHDVTSDIKPAVRTKLLAGLDYLQVAPTVVAVARDVPIPSDLDDTLPYLPARPDALEDMTQRLALGRSMERVLEALAMNRRNR
jgi:5'-3' exonuclease